MRQSRIIPIYLYIFAILGLAAGLLNGLLGAAGGIVLVLILPFAAAHSKLKSSFMGMEKRDWFATALAVMLPSSIISCFIYFSGGININADELVFLLLVGTLGGFVGAVLLGRIPTGLLKKLFAALIIFSGVRMMMLW